MIIFTSPFGFTFDVPNFASAPDIEPALRLNFRAPIAPPPFNPKPVKPATTTAPKKRQRKGLPESPHPSMSIEYLRKLQSDNYVTDGGREFVKYEVDALLLLKEQKRAEQKLKDSISGIPNF